MRRALSRCQIVASVVALVVASVVGAGCSDDPPPEPAAGCNPLIGDDCLTPFPSAFYEAADATSPTGVRVAIDDAMLPAPRHSPALSAARLNRHDGISPSTPFIVYFAAGVDATQLPTLDTLDASITATSAVQVIDFATGARVPVFAELDANAFEGQRKALLIRPMTRLAPASRSRRRRSLRCATSGRCRRRSPRWPAPTRTSSRCSTAPACRARSSRSRGT